MYYVLKDRLGSAYATTDSSGNVVGEMRYYASGETLFSSGSMLTDRLFTGQRWEADLGIYQFGARFYSPTLGRFLSADTLVPQPFNPQNLNRYSYVNNNPVNFTDPSGHIACEEYGGVCLTDTQMTNLWNSTHTTTTTTATTTTTTTSGSGGGSSVPGTTVSMPALDSTINGLYGATGSILNGVLTPIINGLYGATGSILNATFKTGTCPPTEKCSTAELVIGAGLIAVTDVLEAVVLIAALGGGGPIAAAAALEQTAIPLIVVNAIGAYLIFDSGEVTDFNRTALGIK